MIANNVIPSSRRRGGCAIKKISRSIRNWRRRGGQDREKINSAGLTTPPSPFLMELKRLGHPSCIRRGIACCLFIFLLASCATEPDLTVYGTAPEFSLTERSNRTVTRQELAGKVWIADFIFTNCGGVCPLMTAQMRKLQDQLPTDIHFVSFSVDPANDTPEILADYAARNGADPNRWLFLTGDRDTMFKVSKEGFKLAVDDTMGTEQEPITHSTRFVLVDRQGQIRGYYGMEDADAMSRLIADARKLLQVS